MISHEPEAYILDEQRSINIQMRDKCIHTRSNPIPIHMTRGFICHEPEIYVHELETYVYTIGT